MINNNVDSEAKAQDAVPTVKFAWVWACALALVVPNVALVFTEQMAWPAAVANIALPLGVWCLLLGGWRNVGRTVLSMLPVMIYGAFQIVLLYLFGRGIIAIDMLLNVVTTNFSEATELLGNLTPAIIAVCVLYLPFIAWGIVVVSKQARAELGQLKEMRRVGCWLAAVGLVAVGASMWWVPGYKVWREVFPVNVVCNTVSAVERFYATRDYVHTSSGFCHGAHTERADSINETYVLVIGETSRADNWQLMGYDRPTTPLLASRDDLVAFGRTFSQSNTTHKSVPMLMSWLDAECFGDSIYTSKSIFNAFEEAGYSTAFFSNQRRNHSFIDFMGQQAGECVFVRDKVDDPADTELVGLLKDYITKTRGRKFIVLHSYGSHFNYRERYPRSEARFTPDDAMEAARINRDQLINAYDNSIVATDLFLNQVIAALDSLDVPAAMLYVSDHGEDIFDDPRDRFLHASPTPTYWQLHVPLVIWTSPEHRGLAPQAMANARKNSGEFVSSTQAAFHTIIDLAAINTRYFDPTASLISNSYTPPEPLYLNDYNEAVPLLQSGITDYDIPLIMGVLGKKSN